MANVSYGFFERPESKTPRPWPTAHLFLSGSMRPLCNVITRGEFRLLGNSPVQGQPVCRKCNALAKNRFPGEF